MSEHQIPDGRTHYEGCWQDRRHHDCALERIAKLEAERDLLRQNHPFGAMYDALQKLQAENAQLRAALARMQQPVTDVELVLFQGNEPTKSARAIARACRRFADKLLAARAAGKGE